MILVTTVYLQNLHSCLTKIFYSILLVFPVTDTFVTHTYSAMHPQLSESLHLEVVWIIIGK